MRAILLCGGLGTRLRPVIGEKQKAMAYVKGKPFLHVLIDYLKTQSISEFIFACGYKKEEIEEYFADGKDFDIKVEYAVEKEPLGTGGAIKNCLPYIKEEMIYVLNADTLFKIEYKKLYDNMIKNNTD
ncbi:MAG: NTP transferase domain-containing protein, partial [Lachnospiraceae bacterium]|nr:NTP transferase domain-containing protein [Lachnospiraceae bacterium]